MTERIRFDTPMGRTGETLLRRLAEAGHAAYFVGGCVRDALLGRPVKDIDIATSATPDQVSLLYPEAIPTGIAHGTVTIPLDRWTFEVTTFREESAYTDGRRPDNVSFLSEIEGDLTRRDFTVNAMAADLEGRLVDPFGGRQDLAAGLLRAVGDPAERFAEDALRMLRLVRFAAEYGFEPEPATWAEAKLGAPGLAVVAMERVFGEVKRMLSGRDPYRALGLLRESGLLRWTKTRLRLPAELGLAEPPAPRTERNADAVAARTGGTVAASESGDPLRRLADVSEEPARWAFWFARMDLAPEDVDLALSALRTSAAFAADLRGALSLHRTLQGAPADNARRSWTLAAVRFGEDACRRWLSLAAALAGSPDYEWMAPYEADGARWLAAMPAKTQRDLAVGGADVLHAAGVRRGGPWVSALLDKLLGEAALGEVPNERAALLGRIDSLLPQYGIGSGDRS